MASLIVLNGPNLNLLGGREPALYGAQTLADVETACHNCAAALGHQLGCFQYNGEGELVSQVHASARDGADFCVINPGAYTHTSVALRDALLGVALPFIEVHISNVFAREAFRHHSYLSDIAVGVISGLGTHGYTLAVEAASRWLEQQRA